LIDSRKCGRLPGVSTTSNVERMAVLCTVHEHPHTAITSIIGVMRADPGEVLRQAGYDRAPRADCRRAAA
jgi:hypothetical protein